MPTISRHPIYMFARRFYRNSNKTGTRIVEESEITAG